MGDLVITGEGVIFRELRDRRGEAGALLELGRTYRKQIDDAAGWHEQSLAICWALGDRRGQAEGAAHLVAPCVAQRGQRASLALKALLLTEERLVKVAALAEDLAELLQRRPLAAAVAEPAVDVEASLVPGDRLLPLPRRPQVVPGQAPLIARGRLLEPPLFAAKATHVGVAPRLAFAVAVLLAGVQAVLEGPGSAGGRRPPPGSVPGI